MSATYEGMSPGGHETYATSIFSKIKTYLDSNPYGYITSYTDTKNTAGSTDTSSKIFLIGATSQAANPQTYSQDTAYVGTDGCLYSGGTKVLTAHQDISGKADKSATVSTVTWSNNKLTKTINGTTSDVVSAATILDNLTSSQVITALGFTPTANTGTITSVKTTAGAHTTINVSSGAANFNVPTKTSHLTNDSGFVTTDEKVKQTPTTENASYRILLSNDADDTEHVNKVFKNTDLKYNPWTKTLSLSNGGEIYLYPDADIDTSFAWLDNSKLSVNDYDTERSILELTATDLVFPRLTIEGTTYLNTWDGTHTSLKAAITYFYTDLLQIKSLGYKNNLNLTATASDRGTISVCTYTHQTSNTPLANTAGFCFTFINSDSENYGAQIAISNAGVCRRSKVSGSWGTWSINGIDVYLGGVASTNVSTSSYTNITVSDMSQYALINICVSYYTTGRPNYGGQTLSVAQLKKHTREPIAIKSYDDVGFLVRYVNNTTLGVRFFMGTASSTRCLSVHAIL